MNELDIALRMMKYFFKTECVVVNNKVVVDIDSPVYQGLYINILKCHDTTNIEESRIKIDEIINKLEHEVQQELEVDLETKRYLDSLKEYVASQKRMVGWL